MSRYDKLPVRDSTQSIGIESPLSLSLDKLTLSDGPFNIPLCCFSFAKDVVLATGSFVKSSTRHSSSSLVNACSVSWFGVMVSAVIVSSVSEKPKLEATLMDPCRVAVVQSEHLI